MKCSDCGREQTAIGHFDKEAYCPECLAEYQNIILPSTCYWCGNDLKRCLALDPKEQTDEQI